MKIKKKSKMKNAMISLLSLGAVVLTIGAVSSIVKKDDNTTSVSTSTTTKRTIRNILTINSNEEILFEKLYNEILSLNELQGKYDGLTYGIYKNGEQVDPKTFNETDNYTLKVEIPENDSYYAFSQEVDFRLLKLSRSSIKTHMTAIDDQWGSEGSVIVKPSTVFGVNYPVKDTSYAFVNETESFLIKNAGKDKTAAVGGCYYSNKYFYDSKSVFSIWAKTDINPDGFGMFGFWLTGFEETESGEMENNSYKELVFELDHNNEVRCCSGTDPDNYLVKKVEKTFDFDKWHKYSIDYRGETAKFYVDNTLVCEITENLPDFKYVRLNVGLLYPTQMWGASGETSQLQSQHAYFSSLEAYNAAGEQII